MAKIFSKGQRLYIEGSLAYRQWEKADGTKTTSTDILIHDYKKLERDDK